MFIRSSRSSFHYLIAVAVSLTCAATIAIGLTIWWLRVDAIRHASHDTDNLATVLAEQTNRSVQSIDLMLNEVQGRMDLLGARTKNDFNRLLGGEETHQMLTERMAVLSYVSSIALVNKNGLLVNSTDQWPIPSLDDSDREHFQHFKNNDDQGLYVTAPLVDRNKGLNTIYFAKRINDANNEFLGMGVIGVRLSYFQHIYESIYSLRTMAFLLLRKDGTVIVRYPDPKNRAGDKMPAASPWYRLISEGGGHFRSSDYFDSEARLVAVRPLRDYPLVVNVGVSETAALANWRIQATILGIGALLMMLCSVFLLKALSKQYHRVATSEKTLAHANATVDAAVNNMSQGLVMFDASARMVVCNKRYLEMFGLSPDIVRFGSSIRDILDHRAATGSLNAGDAEPYATDILAAVAKGTAFRKIVSLPDGRVISTINQPIADGGWVATHEDITERLVAEEKIRHLAHYDALTDLPNRASFSERFETVLSQRRRSESIAVLSLDLDRFKNVNDTLGHPIGDLLLKAAADRMRSCVRSEDMVARLGGDEFAIVQVPSIQSSDVSALAERLIEVVGAPYDLDGHQVIIGVSVGIAVAPSDGDKSDQLMKSADLALYRAKADGGGAYRFFEVDMDARMQARRALELDLRKALVNGEFELYYQPIVDVKTRHITSCEALIRWHHPERGMIQPTEFISIAEETGLIVSIGEWVIRQACAEAARWPKNLTVAVNLSPAQFKSRNLLPTVISALATSGLPAGRLELEITELVLLQDNENSFAILHQLRELGIRIAMDDFGTGYSSLGYLRSFPFDKIKIDQSFIHDLANKEDGIAIIRAVVGLSSSMGITTTAEGVETKEQLARLTLEGCDEVQGFLFSPPRPAVDLKRIFEEMSQRSEAVA